MSHPSGYSWDEVDRDQRLNQINRATGQPSTNNSFQARLDSILNTTPTMERTLVANEDQAIREKAAESQRIAAENTYKLQTAPRPGKDLTKVKDTALRTKTDMTEKAYQTEREKIQKANLEKKKLLKNPEEVPAGNKPAVQNSGVSLSLTNNPFYHGNFSKSTADFEDQKPVLVSRLIQQQGMAPEDAEKLVAQSSSPEELTISLMQEQNLTYQEAGDITENS